MSTNTHTESDKAQAPRVYIVAILHHLLVFSSPLLFSPSFHFCTDDQSVGDCSCSSSSSSCCWYNCETNCELCVFSFLLYVSADVGDGGGSCCLRVILVVASSLRLFPPPPPPSPSLMLHHSNHCRSPALTTANSDSSSSISSLSPKSAFLCEVYLSTTTTTTARHWSCVCAACLGRCVCRTEFAV